MPAANVSRNDPCPCGSGKKYKKCCMGSPTAAAAGTAPAAIDPNRTLQGAVERHEAGDLERAERLYRMVIEQAPDHLDTRVRYARLLEQRGDLEASLVQLERAVAAGGDDADLHVRRASLLQRLGRAEETLACLDLALAREPEHATACVLAADTHLRMNMPDRARAMAERAVAAAPDDEGAAVMLAVVDRHDGQLETARDRLAGVADTSTDPEMVHRASKELGMVLDRLGDHDAAFAAFQRAGRARLAGPIASRIDASMWLRCLDRYRDALTDEPPRRWTVETLADDQPRPAFLVGFPRSGTTMTEQVLGAHPEIVTTDERPLLFNVIAELVAAHDGDDDLPKLIAGLDVDGVRGLRRSYWEQARALVGDDLTGRVFLDKMPLNIMHVTLIDAVFPEARVITALRDPRDVCLSCLMQRFGLNAAMIHLLEWERAVAFYDRVMGHWLDVRERLTVGVREVRYEDTVTDLPAQARRLLEHLGLRWDDRVLSFHEDVAERFISTPSFAAVSQPVHTKAVGRWHKYRAHVEPSMATLGRFVDAFGYERG